MAYNINKTNGTLIKALPDGMLDTTSTSLTLIGRNVTNFGEAVNENFVKLLENFASPLQPEFPLTGQLWYDTGSNKVNVFDGTNFRAAAGPVLSTSQPTNLVAGDFWINSDTNQLRFYDGTDLVLVGPVYTRVQGETGFKVDTVIDTNKNVHTLCYLYSGNTLLGLFSGDEAYELQYPISGFSGVDYSSTVIYGKGARVRLNNSTYEAIENLPNSGISPTDTNYWRKIFVRKGFTSAGDSVTFDVTTTKASSIVREDGVQKFSSQILYNDEDAVITGALTVQDNAGIKFGIAENVSMRIDTNNHAVFENTITDKNYYFKVKRTSGATSEVVDAITVLTANKYVGLFNSSPTAALDVGGSAKITGNLTVTGTVTAAASNIATASTQVILGNVAAPSSPSDASASGGGIILKATADKSIRWYQSTNRWTSNVGFETVDLMYQGTLTGSSQILNIGSGQIYKAINGDVGLGTASPSAKLHVVGDAKIGKAWVSTLETSISTTTTTPIFSFNVNEYGSADIFVQVVNTANGAIHSAKFTVIHNGTTAFNTKYGEVATNGNLGTFSVNVQADGAGTEFAILYFTASAATAKVVTAVGTVTAL